MTVGLARFSLPLHDIFSAVFVIYEFLLVIAAPFHPKNVLWLGKSNAFAEQRRKRCKMATPACLARIFIK